MAVVQLNRSIKLIDNEIIQITKKFAESNLTKECLKYSDMQTKTHYEWSLEDTGYIVAYELPVFFQFDLYDLSNKMYLYCTDYLRDRNISVDDFSVVFNKNMKKTIHL